MEGFGVFLFPAPPKDEWAVGWLTGPDNDLICVRRVATNVEGQIALSPLNESPLLAALGFVLKRTLLAVDNNLDFELYRQN